jgi:TolB protein
LIDSDRSGNWDIYLLTPGTGDLRQLMTDPKLDEGPRWKPDGTEILFYSNRSGHREIWTMPAGGGPARQITRGEAESYYPSWSPDGRLIVKRGDGIAVVDPQSGREQQLTDNKVDTLPAWSPDGRWIVFTSKRDGAYRLWRVPAAGGRPERLTEKRGFKSQWSPDGKGIYFVGVGENKDNIWHIDIGTRKEQPITALAGRPGTIGIHGLCTDGHDIYFTWEEARSEIWVADIVPSAIK